VEGWGRSISKKGLKKYMAGLLTMQRLLGFKDFFPTETPTEKNSYAKEIGKDLLEKSCCYFLSFFRNSGIPPMDELLAKWFTFNNFNYTQSPSYWYIDQEYRRIKNFHAGEKHSIISVESLLNLFLWLQKNKTIPKDCKNFDASLTIPLLKLFLLFNEDVLKNYQNVVDSIRSLGNERKLQRLIFAGSFSQSDLVNIDYAQLFYTQIYKKTKLLDFLSKDYRYTSVLNALLNEFHCSSKEEFLKAIGNAVLISIKSTEPSWTVLVVDKKDKKGEHILKNLAIKLTKESNIEQDDYLILRNTPFQKIAKRQYRVIFDLFLIKKLYNGLIFKLSTYDQNFLGRIRDDFSERVLVYDTLTKMFSDKNTKNITGNEFKAKRLKTSPDYYSRINDDILLFESKDFFMTGKSKLSYDFNIIENGLKTNEKSDKEDRLKKAVSQLIKNIERCILKEIPDDNNYEVDKIRIFPIIIVHDSLYSAPGLNYWVYYWFIDVMQKMKSDLKFSFFDFNRVMPLTIIEIDTLILYQKYFIERKFDLINLIEQYHRYVRFDLAGKLPSELIEEHAMKSALSFSEFVRNHSHTFGLDIDFKIISKMLNEYGIN
jgi:hypothetical protein